MRKFFYSISVFLFLCLISAGYYRNYGFSEKKQQEKNDTAYVSAQEDNGYGKYYLKELDGLVIVCQQDKKTVFETTGIEVETLPDSLQKEIKAGKYIKTDKELYGFLENYSS